MVFLRKLSALTKNGILRNFSISPISKTSSYDGDGKTTVTVLNKQADHGIMIDGYSQAGFRLNNGMFVYGPMALFPRTALSWNVEGDHEINENSLKLFSIIEPKLDLLIIGFGTTGKSFDGRKLHEFRIKRKINFEILPVEKAAATFNYLVGEGRWVAGAFVPPRNVKLGEQEILDRIAAQRQTYEIRDSFN